MAKTEEVEIKSSLIVHLIENWLQAKSHFTSSKDAELVHRNVLADIIFGDREGAFKLRWVGDTYKVTAESKTTVKVDEDKLNALVEAGYQFSVEENACFSRVLKVNNSSLHKLKGTESKVWNECVTETPATCAVEVVYKEA